jgi:tyrosine-protein phosphatase YwqE
VDFESSLVMLRTVIARGVTGIVATPHSQAILEEGGPSIIHDRISALKLLVSEQSLAIELVPGMEVHLLPDTAERLAAGDCIPLNGTRFALIEFDYFQWANYSDDAVFEISIAGFTSVLAHVDRIAPLAEHPERVQAFVDRGAFTQITAMSILGGFGRQPKQAAEHMFVVKGHGSTLWPPTCTRQIGNRQPWPANTYERVSAVVGEQAAHTLIYVNPARIVAGETPDPVEPRPAKRRWGILPRR